MDPLWFTGSMDEDRKLPRIHIEATSGPDYGASGCRHGRSWSESCPECWAAIHQAQDAQDERGRKVLLVICLVAFVAVVLAAALLAGREVIEWGQTWEGFIPDEPR